MKTLFVAMVLTAFIAACGSAPKPVAEAPKLGGPCDGIPAWYANVPVDGDYIYAKGTSEGEFLEDAEFYATQAAKVSLASNLLSTLTQTAKAVRGLDGAKVDESERGRTTTQDIDVTWKGSEPSPNHYHCCKKANGDYTVYMLARVPQKQVLIDLSAKIIELKMQGKADLFKEKFKQLVREVKNDTDTP